MNKVVKGRMEMATRVLSFAREHPSEAAGYQAAVTRLVEQLAQADAVATRQTTQGLLGKGAIGDRLELRRSLTADLRLLAAIAQAGGAEAAAVPIVIRYPGPKESNLHFLDGAQAALDLAREHEALLLRNGLPEGHLARLAAGLDAYAALLVRRQDAVVARIEARNELDELGRDLSRLADQIGAMTRHRYQHDRSALAAWRYVRSTGRRPQKPEESSPTRAALPPGTGTPEAAG